MYYHLTKRLASQTGCSYEMAAKCCQLLVEWMTAKIIDEGEVFVGGFGKFFIEKNMEFVLVANDGKRILIPPQLKLKFSPAPVVGENDHNGKVFPKIAQMLSDSAQVETNFAETIALEFFKVILDGMDCEETVAVDGLGEFMLTKVKVEKCVYGKVSFKPDDALKEKVNRPFSFFEPVELNDIVSFDDIETIREDQRNSSADDELKGDEVFLISKNDEEVIKAETQEQQVESEGQGDEANLDTLFETGENISVNETAVSEETASEESIEETVPHTSGWHKWGKTAAVIGAVCAIALLLLYVIHRQPENKTVAEIETVSTDTVKTDSVTIASLPKENEKINADTIDFKILNAQIPYGAYDIVGIESTITVRPGMGLAEISRIFLGADNPIYLIVLNNGNNDPQPGEKYMIPKLKLRKNK